MMILITKTAILLLILLISLSSYQALAYDCSQVQSAIAQGQVEQAAKLVDSKPILVKCAFYVAWAWQGHPEKARPYIERIRNILSHHDDFYYKALYLKLLLLEDLTAQERCRTLDTIKNVEPQLAEKINQCKLQAEPYIKRIINILSNFYDKLKKLLLLEDLKVSNAEEKKIDHRKITRVLFIVVFFLFILLGYHFGPGKIIGPLFGIVLFVFYLFVCDEIYEGLGLLYPTPDYLKVFIPIIVTILIFLHQKGYKKIVSLIVGTTIIAVMRKVFGQEVDDLSSIRGATIGLLFWFIALLFWFIVESSS